MNGTSALIVAGALAGSIPCRSSADYAPGLRDDPAAAELRYWHEAGSLASMGPESGS
jgi:hypothetical protein